MVRLRSFHPPRPDGLLALGALLVLLICIFYSFVYTVVGPYSGITIDAQLRVLQVDDCDRTLEWCRTNQASIRPGDSLVDVAGLGYQAYRRDIRNVPFAGYHPNDTVSLMVYHDGQALPVSWHMPPPTATAWITSFTGALLFFPFWLAGTLVLLFLRPRDHSWRLLVLFNYLAAMWLAAGLFSAYRIAGSLLVTSTLAWFLPPVCWQLHLYVAAPQFEAAHRRYFVPLYAIFGVFAGLQFLRQLATSTYLFAASLAVLGSLLLLVIGLRGRASSTSRQTTRLLIAGAALAFGPGVILWIVPQLLFGSTTAATTIIFATLALPLLPLFYTYALYKHRLGSLEFRANRLLSSYSFVSLYSILFILVFLIGNNWLRLPGESLLYSLILSGIFLLGAMPLRQRFQHFVDRLAYGTDLDPDDIIRTFANHIPKVLTREDLESVLTREVLPSLLIEQSALFVLRGDTASMIYVDGISLTPGPHPTAGLQRLLAEAGQFRLPQPAEAAGPFDWVRLAVSTEAGEQGQGLWLLGRRHPDDFYPQKDIALLKTLANQIGVALQTTSLLRASERYAQDLKTMHVVSGVVAGALDSREVYRRTVETLVQVFDYQFVSIYKLDTDRLRMQYQLGYHPERILAELSLEHGIIARAAVTRQPQYVPDVSDDAGYLGVEPAVVSEIAVPLQSGERLLGVMNVESARSGQLTARDLDLLMILANQLSVAIVNAQFFETTRRHLDEVTALARVSEVLNRTLDLGELLQFVLDQALDIAGQGSSDSTISGTVLLRQPHGDALSIAVARNVPDDIIDDFNSRPVYVYDRPFAQTLLEGEWVDLADRGQIIAMQYVGDGPALLQDLAAYCSIPLTAEGVAIGAITLDRIVSDEARRRLLGALADLAAAAIQKARLYQRERRWAAQLKMIQEVSQRVSSNLPPDELMDQLAALFQARFGYYAVSLWLDEGQQTTLSLRARAQPTTAGSAPKRPARLSIDHTGLVSNAFKTNRSIISNDLSVFSAYDSESSLPGTRSEAAVPIRLAGAVLGVLDVQSEQLNAFEEEDSFVLQAMADQIGVALENARLFEQVRDRAEKLTVAYNDLKQLDRMKDEFVQTVSHELRTPLTFVRGYVEVLLDGMLGDLDAPQREALAIVADRTEATIHLVNDIISLQQSELLPPRRQPVSLADVVQTCGQSANMVARKAGITLVFDIDPDLPLVLGEQERLWEVFNNLLGNAIKFSPDGGTITLRVTTAQQVFAETGPEPVPAVVASIQDQGIGIAPDQLERIWERFYQVDGTSTRKFGGTGLGLTIVRRIVEAHGGNVWVESTPGQGTTFHVALAAVVSPEMATVSEVLASTAEIFAAATV